MRPRIIFPVLVAAALGFASAAEANYVFSPPGQPPTAKRTDGGKSDGPGYVIGMPTSASSGKSAATNKNSNYVINASGITDGGVKFSAPGGTERQNSPPQTTGGGCRRCKGCGSR